MRRSPQVQGDLCCSSLAYAPYGRGNLTTKVEERWEMLPRASWEDFGQAASPAGCSSLRDGLQSGIKPLPSLFAGACPEGSPGIYSGQLDPGDIQIALLLWIFDKCSYSIESLQSVNRQVVHSCRRSGESGGRKESGRSRGSRGIEGRATESPRGWVCGSSCGFQIHTTKRAMATFSKLQRGRCLHVQSTTTFGNARTSRMRLEKHRQQPVAVQS